MLLRGLVLLWTAAACFEVNATGLPVGKAEAEFVSGCDREPSGCAFTRLAIHQDQSFSQVDRMIFNLDASQWRALQARASPLWQSRHACADLERVHVEATLVRKDGHTFPVPVRRERAGLYCQLLLDSSALDKVTPGAGARLSIRMSQDGVRSGTGRVQGAVPFVEGMKTRLVVINGGDHALWTDGPVIDGARVRGPVAGGTVVDALVGSRIEGDTLRYSTFQGWAEFAVAYGLRESAMRTPQGQGQPPVRVEPPPHGQRDRIEAVVAGISRQVRYGYNETNAGAYPRRTAADVRRSGYADCKDYSLLLIDELHQQGIEAVSVLTGLSGRTPPSLVVPGFEWANHVLVWIPSEQVFVDLTAGAGSEMVEPASATFGHLGFEVASGRAMVIR